MRTRTCLVLAALALCGIVAAVVSPGVPVATAAPEGETFKIDPVHTNVHFRVKHLSASWFMGRFNETSGNIVWNEADPAKSSVNIEVRADSVDTRTERLDGHIRSPDFLSAAQFPVLKFAGKSFQKVGPELYEVAGDFTVRGVTKAITIRVEHTGTSELHGKRIGFSTTFTINRRDYGVNYGTDDAVGDKVTLVIDVEGLKE